MTIINNSELLIVYILLKILTFYIMAIYKKYFSFYKPKNNKNNYFYEKNKSKILCSNIFAKK